jgi:hypothetical protein
MPKRNSRRIRKQRVPKLEKLALSITTPEQARHGLREVDVANFSDADVKDADSLKRLKTVRKLTRIELLARSGLLTQEQALVCGWYAERHEAGFQTIGCTANYAGTRTRPKLELTINMPGKPFRSTCSACLKMSCWATVGCLKAMIACGLISLFRGFTSRSDTCSDGQREYLSFDKSPELWAYRFSERFRAPAEDATARFSFGREH